MKLIVSSARGVSRGRGEGQLTRTRIKGSFEAAQQCFALIVSRVYTCMCVCMRYFTGTMSDRREGRVQGKYMPEIT